MCNNLFNQPPLVAFKLLLIFLLWPGSLHGRAIGTSTFKTKLLTLSPKPARLTVFSSSLVVTPSFVSLEPDPCRRPQLLSIPFAPSLLCRLLSAPPLLHPVQATISQPSSTLSAFTPRFILNPRDSFQMRIRPGPSSASSPPVALYLTCTKAQVLRVALNDLHPTSLPPYHPQIRL